MIAPDYQQYKDYIDQVDADALELVRLREEVKGPTGFDTWKDAAIDERLKRVALERQLKEIKEVAEELIRVGFDPNPTHRIFYFQPGTDVPAELSNDAVRSIEEFWTRYFGHLYNRCQEQGEKIKKIIDNS